MSYDRLLIEPLWNWNYHKLTETHLNDFTFNRTIVELKRLPLALHTAGGLSFNRTIVELKRVFARYTAAVMDDF